MASPLLTMRGIVKRYGATTALNGVDFDACAGQIHALLGENGAGKSTLMHVLSGLTRPDAGEIRVDGRRVRVDSPRAARALGIAMVHQHFTLVPAFTVAENLALDQGFGVRGSGFGNYKPRREAERALERAAALGWRLDPDARVSDLSVGTQQRVEIIKALATDARLLIFDEPTAVLAGDEVEELFGVLRRLRDEGSAVILIAHKLAEILAVADRVTVLRRGNNVATCPVKDTDAAQLALWMVGTSPAASPHPQDSRKASPAPARSSLGVRALRTGGPA
jgi:simple sugar transport system ATP-binding protein